MSYSPPFTLEVVSQLDRDASTALATIREWRNSFTPINRIPLDIPSLIPTHLASQKDRFHAASVCRHWRGTFLKYGALWTQLFLKKGEEYASTLLDRAKGSALDIITHRNAPGGVQTLISPRARQIGSLEFKHNSWGDIVTFSGFNSGQFPLLRTLKITSFETYDSNGRRHVVTPPLHPFFGGAVNLEWFTFNSTRFQFLNHFAFPTLTTFELSATPTEQPNASYLFSFLEASPMLRTVKLKITSRVVLRGIHQETVVTLPNVETFHLHVINYSTAAGALEVAGHISCPRARDTSLIHETDDDYVGAGLEIFPCPTLWEKIVGQYTTNPMEEVTLEIKRTPCDAVKCSLTFQSSNTTVLRLGFHASETGVDEEGLQMSFDEMGWEIFSQALAAIQDSPLLPHVKRVHFKHRAAAPDDYHITRGAKEVGELFSCLGPLDELTVHGCDLHVFLAAFLDGPRFDDLKQAIAFPPIRELAILHPVMEYRERECTNAIVKLAQSQRLRGIPFERVTVRMWTFPTGMVEELGQWVNEVDYRVEWYREE